MTLIKEKFGTKQFPVFTLTDMRVLLNETGVSKRYLKIIINKMLKRGGLKRIRKGVYTFDDDITVVGFAYRPFYYGMEDALSYRNLWTQAANPIVMTTNTVREGLRNFYNANYLVKRVKPNLFFGFNFIRYYDFWIPVSDAEKTLIDLIYYKHGIRDDALDALAKSIDQSRLDAYLERYGKAFRKKVRLQLERRQ